MRGGGGEPASGRPRPSRQTTPPRPNTSSLVVLLAGGGAPGGPWESPEAPFTPVRGPGHGAGGAVALGQEGRRLVTWVLCKNPTWEILKISVVFPT